MAGQRVDTSFPFEIKEADEETAEKYPDAAEALIFVGPKKVCVQKTYKEVLQKLYNFETRPDDVWMLGFPRSGTTLTSEIVWLLCNNLDYQKAAETIMDLRFRYFESTAHLHEDFKKIEDNLESYKGKSAEIAKNLIKPAWESLLLTPERRFIKTHLHLSLAPSNLLTSGSKIIYVARNPKDVCVSLYMFLTSLNTVGFYKNFEEFWVCFRQGLLIATPYLEHVKEAWEVRDNKNVLFLFYENLSKDMKGTIRIVADFLEKEISEEDLDGLVEHVKIDNFRKNKSVNNDHLRELGILKDKNDSFIRKGKIGGYRDYFQGRIGLEFDEWIKENFNDSDYLGAFS